MHRRAEEILDDLWTRTDARRRGRATEIETFVLNNIDVYPGSVHTLVYFAA